MTMHLDIWIGPVQGFVAQSRRTRDLWGSSYLLSFLSAHAMNGARGAGGTITQPAVDFDKEPMLRWITGRGSGDPPRIGSVPNHFIVRVDDGGHGRAVALAAEKALRAAWARVCDEVWTAFVQRVHEMGDGTQEIWSRQLSGFWEIVWVVGAPEERGLIHRRKHWRSHRLPVEGGDKCIVMPELQELSGYVGARGGRQKSDQVAFWQELRAAPRLGPLDLRKDERLSAVALVKRLYPKVAKKALGWSLDVSHWPSTVYVGALPWIREVARTAAEPARSYASAVTTLASGVIAEKRPKLAGEVCKPAGDFAQLDANYFHKSFIDDPRLCPFDEEDLEGEDAHRELLKKQLQELQLAVGRPPSIFYAILLADGDHLGEWVTTLGGDMVGKALGLFTNSVERTVEDCDGVTIYAGGDDVLAMLPVPRALECAQRISENYQQAFREAAGDKGSGATLSAAVTFAHVRLPLRSVITEAHRLLEQVAKDANGRDSLAAAVLKRGGLHCQWTTTWQRADGAESITTLGRLAEHLQSKTQEEAGFSGSLLHRLHETLGLLCGWPRWEPGAWAVPVPDLDVRAFLAAEVRRSLVDRVDAEVADEVADEVTSLIAELLPRALNGRSEREESRAVQLGVDAMLLARFIASGGAEEVD